MGSVKKKNKEASQARIALFEGEKKSSAMPYVEGTKKRPRKRGSL